MPPPTLPSVRWTGRRRPHTPYTSDELWGEVIINVVTLGASQAPKLLMKGADRALDAKRAVQARMAAQVCSFPEDTPVLMCDGSLRAIQDVQEGDLVLSQDPATGEMGCQQVVDPYANPMRALIAVELVVGDHQETGIFAPAA